MFPGVIARLGSSPNRLRVFAVMMANRAAPVCNKTHIRSIAFPKTEMFRYVAQPMLDLFVQSP